VETVTPAFTRDLRLHLPGIRWQFCMSFRPGMKQIVVKKRARGEIIWGCVASAGEYFRSPACLRRSFSSIRRERPRDPDSRKWFQKGVDRSEFRHAFGLVFGQRPRESFEEQHRHDQYLLGPGEDTLKMVNSTETLFLEHPPTGWKTPRVGIH